MGRSYLISSPKATSTRMKSILALVLLGVAIIHLGGATEKETDTQVAQQESQLDLIEVQELAEAEPRKKCRGGKGNMCKKKKKSHKNRLGKGEKGKRRKKVKKKQKGKKNLSQKTKR